jgi:hypothetical protein
MKTPSPRPATPLTAQQLNRATLARQMLLARESGNVVGAVAQLAGLQAQLARPPFVGLWTRLENFQRQHLLDALHDRSVVRVTAMRGTLHLLSAADYTGWRGMLQPALDRGIAMLKDRAKDLDFASLHAEARNFFGKRSGTFDSLRNHFKALYPDADERAMAFGIRMLLPLVQVPTQAAWGFPAAADFAIADDWLNTAIDTTTAPPHPLVRRYLAAFGPASIADAQTWSGLQGLRPVFEDLRPELVAFRDENKKELFDLPDAPRPAADTPVPVRFLPEFDNLVLAHADRGRFMADEHRSRITTKNLQVRATFLVDGRVAGTWKVEVKKKTATLVLEPFATLTRNTLAALEPEGLALLRFVEAEAGSYKVEVSA